jgi:hypothetical protein
MPALTPHYSREEFARRGQEIYDRDILPKLPPGSDGQFVAIDIESGMWEMDPDDHTAGKRLLSRCPDAQIWLLRVGHRATYRLGTRWRGAESS